MHNHQLIQQTTEADSHNSIQLKDEYLFNHYTRHDATQTMNMNSQITKQHEKMNITETPKERSAQNTVEV